MILRHSVLAALLAATSVSAQQITIRDTIEALPPISICNDGATHRTVCTNMRLRPGTVPTLIPFVGQSLEITGVVSQVTCSVMDVSSVTSLANSQSTTTSTTPTSISVSFFGDGPAGDLYLLFISLGKTNSPQTAPGIIGGVHLNLNVAAFLGLYVPQGPTTSYHTLTMPSVPAAMGVTFYDQALALHANGTAETTVLDCYQF